MTRSAREIGAIVSADIDNLYDGLLDLLPFIDVLVSSKEFPHRLTGISDEHASLIETHARYGCAIVGTTLGIRGALIYCNGSFIESPAFEVPGGCKDTTGAGDAFHVGLIYGMLTGEDVETSLRMANAVGALKCRAIGGRTSLPTLQEVNEIIRMDEV
jgi:sugar/nucleoside kinase (ribokinase family)